MWGYKEAAVHNPERRSHQNPTVLAPWPWPCSTQNCQKQIPVVYKPPCQQYFVLAAWTKTEIQSHQEIKASCVWRDSGRKASFHPTKMKVLTPGRTPTASPIALERLFSCISFGFYNDLWTFLYLRAEISPFQISLLSLNRVASGQPYNRTPWSYNLIYT